MGQITVTVNQRPYVIACDDGQEAHLTRLARYVDQRVSQLVAAVGQAGEARLLLMVSLLLADELSEAYEQAKRLGSGMEPSSDEALARLLDRLSQRIETIAERMEQA
ncbi:MAG: cell division protein ZapA [Rhodospirillales bacterium]|nr:MAG: cell division protein ZapA [Rhodospirillales bacterium]